MPSLGIFALQGGQVQVLIKSGRRKMISQFKSAMQFQFATETWLR